MNTKLYSPLNFLTLFALLFCFASLTVAQPVGITLRPYNELLKMAHEGYPAAMVEVGRRLCLGAGVVKNELDGLAWFETARTVSGEVFWQEKTAKQTEVFYEGLTDEMLTDARERSASTLQTIESNGSQLVSPSTTTIASLKYVRSASQEDNIKGLALLYVANSRFDKSSNDPLHRWSGSLIQDTEKLVGKTGALKAQEYASQLSSVNANWANTVSQQPGWLYFDKTNYLAVVRVFDPEEAKKAEERINEQEKKDLEVYNEILRQYQPAEKSWTQAVKDFFSGGN